LFAFEIKIGLGVSQKILYLKKRKKAMEDENRGLQPGPL
jgi:hypothetical protein